MSNFPLNYTGPDNEQIQLTISSGQFVFLVGANGTGKSTLMHVFASQNRGHVRRITAHRQVWFQSDTVDITPQARQKTIGDRPRLIDKLQFFKLRLVPQGGKDATKSSYINTGDTLAHHSAR